MSMALAVAIVGGVLALVYGLFTTRQVLSADAGNERMREIAEAIQEVLRPKGVGVVADAAHLCMMMRGVQKQNSSTMTSCLLGCFRSDPRTRSEFLDLVRNKLR